MSKRSASSSKKLESKEKDSKALQKLLDEGIDRNVALNILNLLNARKSFTKVAQKRVVDTRNLDRTLTSLFQPTREKSNKDNTPVLDKKQRRANLLKLSNNLRACMELIPRVAAKYKEAAKYDAGVRAVIAERKSDLAPAPEVSRKLKLNAMENVKIAGISRMDFNRLRDEVIGAFKTLPRVFSLVSKRVKRPTNKRAVRLTDQKSFDKAFDDTREELITRLKERMADEKSQAKKDKYKNIISLVSSKTDKTRAEYQTIFFAYRDLYLKKYGKPKGKTSFSLGPDGSPLQLLKKVVKALPREAGAAPLNDLETSTILISSYVNAAISTR